MLERGELTVGFDVVLDVARALGQLDRLDAAYLARPDAWPVSSDLPEVRTGVSSWRAVASSHGIEDSEQRLFADVLDRYAPRR